MKQNRIRARIFQIIMIIYVAAVGFLCFANFHQLPDVPKTFLGLPIDKVIHFCMFFPFPILAFFAYDRLTRTPWQALAALVSICAIGCAFAGLTEVIQETLPYRTKDLHDFGADCIAVGIASVLVFVIDVAKMKKEKE
ncbi:MAG: VanZ family protein [Bacteroidales bacterium]|nr:VanZ family protein [Bacteroidales bacterium]